MFGRKDRPVGVSVSQPTRTEYVTRNIHEHRAPTDESVRLLREMEQAARDSVEQSFNVGGNGFECVVTVEREFYKGKIVEVDETFIGRKKDKPKRRGTGHKHAVLSLVERGGEVRSVHVADIKTKTVVPIITANIAREARVMTDDAARAVKALGSMKGRRLTYRDSLVPADGVKSR